MKSAATVLALVFALGGVASAEDWSSFIDHGNGPSLTHTSPAAPKVATEPAAAKSGKSAKTAKVASKSKAKPATKARAKHR